MSYGKLVIAPSRGLFRNFIATSGGCVAGSVGDDQTFSKAKIRRESQRIKLAAGCTTIGCMRNAAPDKVYRIYTCPLKIKRDGWFLDS